MDLMALIPELESNEEPEPVIKHDCREPQEEDLVESLIEGSDLWHSFKRWLTRKRILSTSHYYAKTCLKSSTAIKTEISYHLYNFSYMIHPFSPFRNFWDLLMTFFTLTTLFLTPFLEAFFEDQMHSLPYLMIIDFVMLFDVVLMFFTGYFDRRTKTVYFDPKIVCSKYIKGYFIFDLISAVPLEVFDFLIHGDQALDWYCTMLNFVKIIRMRNLIHYFHHFHKSYHMSFHKVKILELTIIVVISIHWASCLVYYVPRSVQRFNQQHGVESESWVFSESMKRRDTELKKYILCLNRATTSLVSSVHYLPVSTVEDMIMNFALAIFGKIGFVYLLCQFMKLLTTFHSSNKERMRLLQQLQEYMRYKELPRSTQKRLLVYCNYCYKKNFNRDKRILAQVSQPLREQLTMHTNMRLLETVDLLQLLPQPAIVKLVNFIKPQIYLSGDTIVKAGTRGDSLFFLGSGTVAVYTGLGKEVCHLEDGSYFGEIALVMENELRVASVVAIETCEILVVPREAFQQVIAPYPNLLIRLQKVALERLEKTLFLDEIYRLEDAHPRYINISNIRGKRRD